MSFRPFICEGFSIVNSMPSLSLSSWGVGTGAVSRDTSGVGLFCARSGGRRTGNAAGLGGSVTGLPVVRREEGKGGGVGDERGMGDEGRGGGVGEERGRGGGVAGEERGGGGVRGRGGVGECGSGGAGEDGGGDVGIVLVETRVAVGIVPVDTRSVAGMVPVETRSVAGMVPVDTRKEVGSVPVEMRVIGSVEDLVGDDG